MHAFEDGARSGESFRAEARRRHARARGSARVQALGRRAVGEVLDDAAGQAAGDAERIDELPLRRARVQRRRRRPPRTCRAPRSDGSLHRGSRVGCTSASRHSVSTPIAMPSARCAPSRPKRSHAASTAGTTTAPLCTGPPSNVSSKSSPCAAVPLSERRVLGAKRLRVTDRRARAAGVERALHRLDVVGPARGDAQARRRRARGGRPARAPLRGSASARTAVTRAARRSATDGAVHREIARRVSERP